MIGGWGLWRIARIYAAVSRNIAARDAHLPPDQHTSTLGLNLLWFLERAVWVIGVGTPVLAAIGFFAASQAFLYPMILTLGLFGANLVLSTSSARPRAGSCPPRTGQARTPASAP